MGNGWATNLRIVLIFLFVAVFNTVEDSNGGWCFREGFEFFLSECEKGLNAGFSLANSECNESLRGVVLLFV